MSPMWCDAQGLSEQQRFAQRVLVQFSYQLCMLCVSGYTLGCLRMVTMLSISYALRIVILLSMIVVRMY